jgi:Protein of unknown function (DUF4197)
MRRLTCMARALVLGAALLTTGCESLPLGEIGQIGEIGEIIGPAGQGGVLSNADIDAGLREALTIGANLVTTQLGRKDGFLGDPQVRIPLPGRWREAQTQLAKLGASGPLDDVELRMNRAAEAAIPQARSLVIGAISEMTIDDALNILNGGDTAATDFLRAKTEAKLEAAFTPYVRSALAESGAFTSLERVAAAQGLGGVTSNLQTDLTTHAVDLGMNGLFYYVAEEEKKIRENPVARTTELLRRVFGAQG